MADNRPPRQEIDPQRLAGLIQVLDRQTDVDFAEALADCIMDPEPVEVAAFRSGQLAHRSLAATQFLIDHANTTINTREGEDASRKWKQRATARFRDRVGLERKLLIQIVNGELARQGRDPSNAPSAQGRALRRLKQLHLDEFQALKREEQEKIDAENRPRREERSAAKRNEGRHGP